MAINMDWVKRAFKKFSRVNSLKKIISILRNKYRSKLTSRRFNTCGSNFSVDKNVTIQNPQYIRIGNNVGIGKEAGFFPCIYHAGIKYNPQIIIGDNVWIGVRNSFAAINKIQIGNNVLFAGFVHITDHSHGYEDVEKPIIFQPLIHKGPIIIEDDCWLGFSCEILSGVHIGKHSIIAARAVVTKDVPAYTVVAGNPARIVKQYNFDTKKWEKFRQ